MARAVAVRKSIKDEVFDASQAEVALGEFKDVAATLAQHEAGRVDEYRAFSHAALKFTTALFPEEELASLKTMAGKTHVKITINSKIRAFLKDHDLPEPYWTSSNPFIGIYQTVFAKAIQDGGHVEALKEIEDAGELEPEKVIRLALEGTPKHQLVLTNQNRAIKPVVAKNNAWYLRISKYSMLALAAIDIPASEGGGSSLIDEPINQALEKYRKWRRKNDSLAIIRPGSKKTKTRKLKPYWTAPDGKRISTTNEAEGTLVRLTKDGGCEIVTDLVPKTVIPEAVTPMTEAVFEDIPDFKKMDAALNKKFKRASKVTTEGFGRDEDTVVMYIVRKTPGKPIQIWNTGDAQAIAGAVTLMGAQK